MRRERHVAGLQREVVAGHHRRERGVHERWISGTLRKLVVSCTSVAPQPCSRSQTSR